MKGFKNERSLFSAGILFSLGFYLLGAVGSMLVILRLPSVRPFFGGYFGQGVEFFPYFALAALPAVTLLVSVFLGILRFSFPAVMTVRGMVSGSQFALFSLLGKSAYVSFLLPGFVCAFADISAFVFLSVSSIGFSRLRGEEKMRSLPYLLVNYGVCMLVIMASCAFRVFVLPKAFDLTISVL